jgi:methyl-accepting chemotaxis protein
MTFNLTIRQKLTAFSLMGLAFMLAVGVSGLVSTQRMARASGDMATNTTALKAQMLADMMHDALRGDAMRGLLAGQQKDEAQFKSIRADLDEHSKLFTSAIEELAGLPIDAEIKASAHDLKPSLTAYLRQAHDVINVGLTNPEGAARMLPAFQASFKALEGKMEQLNAALEARAQSVDADSASAASMARIVILGVAVLASIISISIGYVLVRSIVRPIAEATHIATTVAAGDLTSRIDSHGHDEIGQLFAALKAMNDKLADIVGAVRLSGDNIATGSSQIASGNADLSHRTEQQASSLQQTASSMEELTSTVKHNTESAQQATQLASSASQVAARGGAVVNQVVGTMNEISMSSRKIADIIGVIDGIAFQTNILALNAAVEAARAGEQGRGFAVVASEVRSLAGRSADAAKEIKSLINDSVEKVETGSRLVDEAGQTMDDIVGQVRRVSDLIGEISAATLEQNSGIGQVSSAVNDLDQVTQQNAALVEESAAAAESLKQQAHRLVEAVSVFKLSTAPH